MIILINQTIVNLNWSGSQAYTIYIFMKKKKYGENNVIFWCTEHKTMNDTRQINSF